MNEAGLQAHLEGQLAGTGLLWHHCGRPEFCRGGRGFPDLVVGGQDRWLAAELKSEDGRRSLAQVAWGASAERAGVGYRLWRPGDWPETILTELDSMGRVTRP